MKSVESTRAEATDDMLRWAFDGPLPLDELEAWLAASSVQRDAVLLRLRAIREWREIPRGDPHGRRQALAEEVGISQGALANLSHAWSKAAATRTQDGRDARSLSVLRLRTEPHSKPAWSKKEEAHKTVKAIIRSIKTAGLPDSELPVEAVVSRVMAHSRFKTVELGVNAVRRIVHEVRAAAPRARVLGAHVTFDEVALALRDAEGRSWRCTIVLDVGSRLALGAAVVNGTPGSRTLAAAARSAACFLRSTPLPGIASAAESTRVTVAVTDQDAMETLRLFSDHAGWSQQEEVPGKLVRAALGPALGRVRIAFGEGATALEQRDLPIVTRKQMVALLSRAMSRHNAGLIGKKAETDATASKRVELADLLRNAARELWR